MDPKQLAVYEEGLITLICNLAVATKGNSDKLMTISNAVFDAERLHGSK